MLGETFTGAELASEVNDKLSVLNGGTIQGNVNFTGDATHKALHHITDSGELIPFRPFIVKQYVGTYSTGTTPANYSPTNINVGFRPSLVIVFSNNYNGNSDGTVTRYGDGVTAIATTDSPFTCPRGNLVEITDDGFILHSYPRLYSGEYEYPGFNISDQKYTALVFPQQKKEV